MNNIDTELIFEIEWENMKMRERIDDLKKEIAELKKEKEPVMPKVLDIGQRWFLHCGRCDSALCDTRKDIVRLPLLQGYCKTCGAKIDWEGFLR